MFVTFNSRRCVVLCLVYTSDLMSVQVPGDGASSIDLAQLSSIHPKTETEFSSQKSCSERS
jgi:hypothetical protein